MNYTGILCGNFSTNAMHINVAETDKRWKLIVKNEQERSAGYNYYSRKFYDFSYGDGKYDGIVRYEMSLDKDIYINIRGKDYPISIKRLCLYECPLNIMLFSINVDLVSDNIDEITLVMSQLRNIISDCSNDDNIREYYDAAIKPIVDIYRKYSLYNHGDATNLVEYGNKLRLFQILEVENFDTFDKDMMLYKLGTLSLINNDKLSDPMSPSQEYYNSILNDNKISIFNNWTALSLFDTFSIIGCYIQASTRDNWINNYFGMIYISQIFAKFFLARLNERYNVEEKKRKDLVNNYENFECNFMWSEISYNFLPRIILDKMSMSLKIAGEKESIYQKITRQEQYREKITDNRMNKLLFIMTCFTMSSAIWDASCMLNEMYPFGDYLNSSYYGFRLTGFALMITMLVVIMIVLRRSRK